MTKEQLTTEDFTPEQIAYAATLNMLGSGIPDPSPEGKEWALVDTLGRMHLRAAHSTGPHADCPQCYWTVSVTGDRVVDGEHFADLWEHMITRHGFDPRFAEDPARKAWTQAVAEYEGATAA